MRTHLLGATLGLTLLAALPALAGDPAPCRCGGGPAACAGMACACGGADGGACAGPGMGLGGGMGMGPGMHRGMAGGCPGADGGACTGPGMGMGPGPMMMGGQAAFDARTVSTFQGTVTAVERVQRGPGMTGVHLRVQAGAESLEVHLGPAAYVDPRLTFAAKDAVEVQGSRVTLGGQAAVLAIRVTKGGKTLELRRADGTPLFRPGPR